ncbi:MAG: hypothetical protein M3O70_09675 [Actinomycetota bacterium]|nr:hypothetical protein [Actinomycetota bacterium]
MPGVESVWVLPRIVLSLSLKAARLPVTTAGRLLGQADNREWPPNVLFDGFEANVREFVAGLLRDQEMVEQGRVERDRVDHLRTAAELDAISDQRRQQAQTELQERRERDEQLREQVDRKAEEDKQRLERERRSRAKQAEERAREQQREADRARERSEQELAKEERDARRIRVEAEADAVAAEREAAERKAEVLDRDEKIEQSKSQRSAR